MESELIDIIRVVQQKKKDAGTVPEHALFIKDLMPGVIALAKDILKKLVKDKKIDWSRTINDDAFKIVDDGE